MNHTGYVLSDADMQRVSDWWETIKPQVIAIQKLKGIADPLDQPEPYYGAIGGGLTYEFTPTGVGTIVKVKESSTGLELDLTDYESW